MWYRCVSTIETRIVVTAEDRELAEREAEPWLDRLITGSPLMERSPETDIILKHEGGLRWRAILCYCIEDCFWAENLEDVESTHDILHLFTGSELQSRERIIRRDFTEIKSNSSWGIGSYHQGKGASK